MTRAICTNPATTAMTAFTTLLNSGTPRSTPGRSLRSTRL